MPSSIRIPATNQSHTVTTRWGRRFRLPSLTSIQILATLLLLPALCRAHEPITTKLTWTAEISRIVYKHCVSCHRPGGAAPMALITYDESRPWAKAIRDEVAERRMPPWGAVKGFGEFRDDPSLTDPEIEMLVLWVEGGAPKGDDIYLPPVPEFPAVSTPAPPTRGIEVRGETRLAHAILASGIAPGEMPADASLQIVARLPGGRIENLLWLRNTRAEWKRSFYFRQPILLPKGTLIAVHSAVPALILTGKPGQ
jgi:hypothetical protein